METSKRAIGYCRLSQDDKDSPNTSIENQQRMITEYAQKNELQLLKIYNEGIQKSTDWDREQFNELRKQALLGTFDVLCVKDETRLSRDISLLMMLVRDFKALGLKIITISNGEDLTKSEIMTGIKASIAADTIDKGRYNQAQMMLRKQSDGLPFGRPPYGYKVQMIDGKKQWVIYDGHIKNRIKAIFEKFINGEKMSDMARQYNSTPAKIWHIIKEPKYAGIMKVIKLHKGAENKILRKEKVQYNLKDFQTIITPEQFEQAQRKLRSYWRYKPEENSVNMINFSDSENGTREKTNIDENPGNSTS